MTIYQPMDVIPGYSDERLSGGQPGFSREIADLFLTIPAEYRQAAEIEVHKRTSVTTFRNGEAEQERIGNPHEARRQIIAEICAQLGQDAS